MKVPRRVHSSSPLDLQQKAADPPLDALIRLLRKKKQKK
jgi:hypothetical protein